MNGGEFISFLIIRFHFHQQMLIHAFFNFFLLCSEGEPSYVIWYSSEKNPESISQKLTKIDSGTLKDCQTSFFIFCTSLFFRHLLIHYYKWFV